MVTPGIGNINEKARHAAVWSLLTEVLARIITPVTQLILARLLAPEAFGVVATILVITSFGEMLADSGFQKFLIQRPIADKKSLNDYANVAFWTSLAIAILLVGLIAVSSDKLAAFAGNPGLGFPLLIAATSLPLTVGVSTQMALFHRALEYKKLLPIRVGAALTTLIVAVPMASLNCGYWSLIAGILASTLVQAVALTVISSWKPQMRYSFTTLRQMFSLSGWSLLEAISIWLNGSAIVFIVGRLLGSHELGLFRQPLLLVVSMFAVVTAATTPVLFSSLSRLQSDPPAFRAFFFTFQFYVSLLVLPIGVGAFFFRDFLTVFLFGSDWSDGALMFGVASLSMGLLIVLSHFCSEIFRSIGRPQVSLFSQIVYLAVMIPVIYYAATRGFTTLVIVSGIVRIVQVAINQVLTYIVVRISFWQVLGNLYPPLIAVSIMGVFAAWLGPISRASWALSVSAIAICAAIYIGVCLCFPRTRSVIFRALGYVRARVSST